MVAMLDGLLVVLSDMWLFVLTGVLVATVVAVIPGLGGLFALAVLLPFAWQLEPLAGIAMLMGATAVSGTANTITSVMFGIPGSPGGVATVFDGHPMAQRGEGVRAATAGIGASVVGALIGAVALAAAIPVMRPLALLLGPSEFFVLIVAALALSAVMGPSDTLKSLVAGGLGLMLSFVGLEQSTATARYTFGQLRLWDGIPLVPVLIGLFAMSEMAVLLVRGRAVVGDGTALEQRGQVMAGLRDVMVHWRTTISGSVTGVWVGIAPGLGEAASQFIAYGQAARWSRHPERFGTGIVEGVIAADAATNSKEGGALIPTLAFGVPGSASMAVLLAAFMAAGIQPGRALLEDDVHLIWMLIWVLVLGNLVAGALALLLICPAARLTVIRPALLVPPILLLSVLGAYATNGRILDVVIAAGAGFVGYAMRSFDYSRAALLIGFVLGAELERNLLLATRLYGPQFILRPVALALAMVTLTFVLGPWLQRTRHRRMTSSSDHA